MRSAFDFAPFRRSTVGFDRLFDMLENSAAGRRRELPAVRPHQARRQRLSHRARGRRVQARRDRHHRPAERADRDRRGQKSDEDGSDYIYRGIANRSFERRFALADHIQVRGADLKDGLLSIELVREIPEAMKPRKIEISGSAPKHDRIEATAKEDETA